MDDCEGALRHAVLSHLLAHPDAEDDLEGIAEWWVLEHCVRSRVGEVARVLGRLAAGGLVVVRQHPATGTRYRLNAERLADVRRELAAAPPAPSGSGR